MLKLTTHKHEASRGLSATAELLVITIIEPFEISTEIFTEARNDQNLGRIPKCLHSDALRRAGGDVTCLTFWYRPTTR